MKYNSLKKTLIAMANHSNCMSRIATFTEDKGRWSVNKIQNINVKLTGGDPV